MNQESISMLSERLGTAASVASFRSTPVASFRRHLNTVLKEAVSSSRRHDDIDPGNNNNDEECIRYHPDSLKEGLKGLPWKEICRFHDEHRVTRASSTLPSLGKDDDSTTPLEEVLRQLLDASVVPRSCVGVVVGVLLESLLESPRTTTTNYATSTETTTASTRWTPSQLLLLQSIKTLWNGCCLVLSHIFLGLIISPLLKSSQNNHCFTPHKWNRLLSAASHMAADCPPQAYPIMLVFVLKIIGHVDQMEMDTRQSVVLGDGDEPLHRPTGQCRRCSGDMVTFVLTPQRQRSRGVRLARLEDLHDKDISTTDYRPKYLSQRSLPVGGISLKQVLSAKRQTNTTTPTCQCQSRDQKKNPPKQEIQPLPNEWRVVRCRGYKKFLTLFQKQQFILGMRDLPGRFDLHRLLQAAHDECQSPCIRLLLVLACRNSISAIRASHMTWARFVATTDPKWLRIYTEMVTEWSSFDQADACWKAFHPLVNHVLKVVEAKSVQLETQQSQDHRCQGIFQCLAHILSRRSRLFLVQEAGGKKIHEQFQSFVTHVTIHFGEMMYWFDANERNVLDESSDRFCVLQRLGILGLTSDLSCSDEDESTENDEKNNEVDNLASSSNHQHSEEELRDWPFSQPFDLRSAYERVGALAGRTKFDDWDSLLTSTEFDSNLGRLIEERDLGKTRGGSTAPPMTDRIDNPDLLLQIFQHSGYQEIVKSRQVCRAWKTTIDSSNSLWQGIYQSRFPTHLDDPNGSQELCTAPQHDWKGLFIQKLLVERSLLHKRHQGTGWKHRTCSYIGCYHILKSERLETMHHKFHQRKVISKKSSQHQTPPKYSAESRKRVAGKKAELRSAAKKQAKTRVSLG